jgi:hypothetical protein
MARAGLPFDRKRSSAARSPPIEPGRIALLHPNACGGSISKQANIETQGMMAEAVNQGRLEVLREVFAPDVRDHDPAPDQGPDRMGSSRFSPICARLSLI